jgi:hypothetical protein
VAGRLLLFFYVTNFGVWRWWEGVDWRKLQFTSRSCGSIMEWVFQLFAYRLGAAAAAVVLWSNHCLGAKPS